MSHPTSETPNSPRTTLEHDAHRSVRGFTLVETLIVVVILGVLATTVVFAVRGTTTQARGNACGSEQRAIVTAVEAYLGQTGSAAVPATGSGADRYERTLIAAEMMRDPSSNWELAADGTLTAQAGGQCT